MSPKAKQPEPEAVAVKAKSKRRNRSRKPAGEAPPPEDVSAIEATSAPVADVEAVPASEPESVAEPVAVANSEAVSDAVQTETEERPDSDSGTDRHENDDGAGTGSNKKSRSRRGRGSQRKNSVNYRDLQSKILPELHLLAKEIGLEDYRQMAKDDLAEAILELVSASEGLRLVRGYLAISSDGYGFLQQSLLQNNTRNVIVSAGLIKQFQLRTGDLHLGQVQETARQRTLRDAHSRRGGQRRGSVSSR